MIRIRHPGGVSTVKVESSTTLADLQALIFSETSIEPHEQELKSGYPPKAVSLHSVPGSSLVVEPPLSINRGKQLLVARKAASGGPPSRPVASAPALARPTPAASSASSSASQRPLFAADNAADFSFVPKPITTTERAARAANESDAMSVRRSRGGNKVQDGEVHVEVDGSWLVLKVVPDDNSCLFNSIGYVFEQKIGSEVARRMRQIVADVIQQDHETYPDVVLAVPRDVYIKKILTPNAWGGAIELSIFSKHFRVEIDSIDVATGVVHRFGEDEGYPQRCIVIYSGIHYDALTLLPTPDAPAEFGNTIFEAGAADILPAAQRLVKELQQRKYYTDTANFSLKCNTCGTKLTGEKQAQEHAMKSGHTDFGEV